MNKQSGQISIVEIVSIASGIFLATIGGWMAQNYRTDDKIGAVKTEVSATSERVAKVETDIATIKDDQKEIKNDVKSLLKLLK